MDLRKAFFEIMCELAERDEKVILITGDLGFNFYEEYASRFPKQFLNAGCIEQSMISIASGMAKAGLKPYVYSGAIFLLCRANEQIRDDICYNNLNVKLIGTSSSGFLGFTHNFYFEKEENYLKGLPNIQYLEARNEERLKIALKLLTSRESLFIKL